MKEAIETPETTFVSFDKPLTPAAKRTLDLLMERYTDDKGQPLALWNSEPDRDDQGFVALHIPRVVKPKFFDVDAA